MAEFSFFPFPPVPPETTFIVTPEQRISYGQFAGEVGNLAQALSRWSFSRGPLACWGLPPVETLQLLWAGWSLGATTTVLDSNLPETRVKKLLALWETGLLIAGREMSPEPGWQVLSWEELKTAGAAAPRERTPSARPATIVFTSGTSGVPKGVHHHLSQHWFQARGSNRNLTLGPGHRWMLVLPLHHIGGLAVMFRVFLAGATLVLPADRRYFWEEVVRNKVSHVSLVSTQFQRWMDAAPSPPPGLRAVLLGGGPLPEELLRQGRARGWPLHASYGSTEMGSQVCTTAPGAPLEELLTAGRVLPYRQLRIADDGEILLRGTVRFNGYWTAQGWQRPFDADGWFASGDLGFLDAKGRLHVTGRRDARFKAGGEWVQPELVERLLRQHPAVAEAVVVKKPDPEFQFRPVAFITWRAAPPGRREFDTWLREHLARHERPAAFYALPGGGGLKPRRKELEELVRHNDPAVSPLLFAPPGRAEKGEK